MTSKTRVSIKDNGMEWICYIIGNDNSTLGTITLYKMHDGSYSNIRYSIDTISHWHIYEMAKVAKRIFNKHRFNRVTPEQILKTLNAIILSQY